ncbi:heme-binding protein [Mycobacterium sp. E740]|uniref:heme-binding protein n=1 Tax=Mycobacterium sp. E740 TaxID=1834149 RepID=UPI0007FE9FE6|nr:heme-binding protein [Mycobacterium sp. E740]OBI72495.1 hypothetical protein A5663_00850 [Mycobacterium sp. E740]
MLNVRTPRWRTRLACTAALCGAALSGAAGFAHAVPESGMNPPGCTAADLEGVRAGVDASTSAYLFSHPDLNGFIHTMQGKTREQVADQMKGYMAGHPQENAEMTGIRQPLVDLKNRCGAMVTP